MSDPVRSVVLLLAKAESEILLLARSHPTNWQALKTGLQASWARGECREPSFEFQRTPDLQPVHAALAHAVRIARREGPLGEHLARRAAELDDDACLVEQIGKPGFRSLAARRYAYRCREIDERADALAASWSDPRGEPEGEPGVMSDDFANPLSLVNLIRREMELCGVAVPIRVDGRLAATATVDRDCIWVRPGELLRPKQATRIAVHEIRGHAWRRVVARLPENFSSSAGFALSDEDEEGRAIWLEQQAGLLGEARRAELARRHLAATACHGGATFVDTMALLASLGTPPKDALTIALRVWRGGGLAREVLYLRSYVRVGRVLSESPEVELWMQRGRFSIEVASELSRGVWIWPDPPRS